MGSSNSFDALVSGISAEERQSILDKMQSTPKDYENDSFSPVEDLPTEPETTLSEQLKKESLPFRFWLWLKSIFTNTSTEILFNEIKIQSMAKIVGRNFPGLIDMKRGFILPAFYDKLRDLKKSADFFRPYVVSFEQDEGAFYVFLGSIVMPIVARDLADNVDPYTNPVTGEAKLEYRVELLRQMDDIFQSIPADSKNEMYEAVKSVDWLRQFVRLPFNRFLSLFSEITDEIHTCQFSQIENEIGAFAKCLLNSFRLPNEVLETLFLFSIRNSKKKGSDSDENSNDAVEFMSKAMENMSNLHMFMSSVPIHSISCIVYSDSQWMPEHFSGGEDWFVKFKTSWKKIFEQKWDSWVFDCKKENLRQSLVSRFSLESFPILPNRPWENLWGGVKFRYELTGGFLYWYFLKEFPTYEIVLKSIMVEGVFKKKDNQLMYTDTFNDFIHISMALNALNDRIKPSGDVGSTFAKFSAEGQMRTLQEQTRVEQLMRSVESEMQLIINQFGTANRSMNHILSGLLGLKKEARFDTLSNIGHLSGRGNENFLSTLQNARDSLENALNIIKELEMFDAPHVLAGDGI
ncbi:DUF5312 domain-containing protein [Treponema saccharophilum]|uniref:Uncharacterized protein n=2 Tax=Treponema saccharophilum TaxID=165 RepID=H7ELM5_9SPIR|nr:DUF5312 domain-containing protein [Treponema saccharophilum]EIC01566.1 hypothetical protein TresaDRAFT_1175 [Treponema saccharophilum DSM 2985]BDC95528.1 hypothetical protein TRSA_06270 [Treponema saccharophilum]